ncbi:MAG: DUF6265 family protein [Rhodospirillaceae bacterium]
MRTLIVGIVTTLLAAPSWAAEFNDISFMSGCWKTAPGVSPEYRECYTAPKAGMMQGSSQTIENGKTTFFEFSLVLEDAGKIVYRPFLKGVQSVDFTLTKLAAGEAVFENLAHDFPQRVIYRKGADGKLTARIEDAAGKKFEQWVMQPQ